MSLQIKAMIHSVKTQGVKATWREFGWKVVFAIFMFYLIRDLTIYVFIPLLTWKLLS